MSQLGNGQGVCPIRYSPQHHSGSAVQVSLMRALATKEPQTVGGGYRIPLSVGTECDFQPAKHSTNGRKQRHGNRDMATEGHQVAASAALASEEPSGSSVENWPPRPEALVVLAAAPTMISIYLPHDVAIAIEGRQMSTLVQTAQASPSVDYSVVGSWAFIARLVLAVAGVLLGVWGNIGLVPMAGKSSLRRLSV